MYVVSPSNELTTQLPGQRKPFQIQLLRPRVVDGRVALERPRVVPPLLVDLARVRAELDARVEDLEAAGRRLIQERLTEGAVAGPVRAADGDVVERPVAHERRRRDPGASHE